MADPPTEPHHSSPERNSPILSSSPVQFPDSAIETREDDARNMQLESEKLKICNSSREEDEFINSSLVAPALTLIDEGNVPDVDESRKRRRSGEEFGNYGNVSSDEVNSRGALKLCRCENGDLNLEMLAWPETDSENGGKGCLSENCLVNGENLVSEGIELSKMELASEMWKIDSGLVQSAEFDGISTFGQECLQREEVHAFVSIESDSVMLTNCAKLESALDEFCEGTDKEQCNLDFMEGDCLMPVAIESQVKLDEFSVGNDSHVMSIDCANLESALDEQPEEQCNLDSMEGDCLLSINVESKVKVDEVSVGNDSHVMSIDCAKLESALDEQPEVFEGIDKEQCNLDSMEGDCLLSINVESKVKVDEVSVGNDSNVMSIDCAKLESALDEQPEVFGGTDKKQCNLDSMEGDCLLSITIDSEAKVDEVSVGNDSRVLSIDCAKLDSALDEQTEVFEANEQCNLNSMEGDCLLSITIDSEVKVDEVSVGNDSHVMSIDCAKLESALDEFCDGTNKEQQCNLDLMGGDCLMAMTDSEVKVDEVSVGNDSRVMSTNCAKLESALDEFSDGTNKDQQCNLDLMEGDFLMSTNVESEVKVGEGSAGTDSRVMSANYPNLESELDEFRNGTNKDQQCNLDLMEGDCLMSMNVESEVKADEVSLGSDSRVMSTNYPNLESELDEFCDGTNKEQQCNLDLIGGDCLMSMDVESEVKADEVSLGSDSRVMLTNYPNLESRLDEFREGTNKEQQCNLDSMEGDFLMSIPIESEVKLDEVSVGNDSNVMSTNCTKLEPPSDEFCEDTEKETCTLEMMEGDCLRSTLEMESKVKVDEVSMGSESHVISSNCAKLESGLDEQPEFYEGRDNEQSNLESTIESKVKVDEVSSGTPGSVEGKNASKKASNLKNTVKSKKKKIPSICSFVGEPISEEVAQKKWQWRYELKSKDKGQSEKLNADEEDEIILNVKCHYARARVGKCLLDIGDCVYVKGEGTAKHVGRILEFFETMEEEDYFRVQWFFRAEDTVLKDTASFHDKKRLFYSTLMNDNPLDCIISKVNVVKVSPEKGPNSKSVQSAAYYYDMEYCVDYSTFRTLSTETSKESLPFSLDSEHSDDKPVSSTPPEIVPNLSAALKPELTLLDLYSGCGGMSTGLCFGTKLSNTNLVTKWAVDYNSSACDSLKLNHPETQVRNGTAEDFLELLKEWKQLCNSYACDSTFKRGTKRSRAKVRKPDKKSTSGEYEVSSLVDICYGNPNKKGKPGLHFKVRWKGYDPDDDTWEPIEGLSNCQDRIKEFVMQGFESKILPLPGDVDVICGGPPCQGISGYNRHRNFDSPLDDDRNRQIVVFMDIVEFLQPKFVLMENVVDIIRFDKGSLGRYALSRLVHMKYQARLGTMASGCYGLPQYRLRVFIWGADPGEMLPQFPLPTHDVIVRYWPPTEFERNVVAYEEGQPRSLETALVLRDSISDLQPVPYDETREEMAYEKPPETEFQSYIRLSKAEMMGLVSTTKDESSVLYDHRPLPMLENEYSRICLIPHRKGANFRDLPGVIVGNDNVARLDPTKEPPLLPNGKPLVPQCVLNFEQGKSKRPYARLWWDENVSTVVTYPNVRAMAIIHPEQDRCLTIRECARLQGFPDFYKFSGSITQRYCQVGNAVSIPVARALGYALGMAYRKAIGDEHLMKLPPKFSTLRPLASTDQTAEIEKGKKITI